MKLVLLIAAFVCALIAMALGFELIDANNPEVVRVEVAWLATSVAAYVAALVIGER